ncbi:MAG: FG-GAP repeat protein, partial [Pyrinomonadaceae bacterium]|nr:FG-GAP repeat protein [Phycisphaerales bacterium]
MKRTRRPSCPWLAMEMLEARSLFSGYVASPLVDYFGLSSPFHELSSPDAEAVGFGTSVMGLGDIDSDGVPDFAISAPGPSPAEGFTSGPAGRLYIYSGATAALLRTLTDGMWEFGSAISDLGDVNSDGIRDLLVGSPQFDLPGEGGLAKSGRAYIYSGADGAVLHTFDGTTHFSEFGRAVSRVNDTNGDDVQDYIIGAPQANSGFNPTAFIFSGADGSLIRTHGSNMFTRFGAAIAGAPDEGADSGFYAIAAPWEDPQGFRRDIGAVNVYRLDGTLAYTLRGERQGDTFGTAIVITNQFFSPEVPASRNHRLIVGIPGADTSVVPFARFTENQGRVESYNLADGVSVGRPAVALNPVANARMGQRLAVLPDLNFDGAQEVAIFAPGTGRLFTYTPMLFSLANVGGLGVPAPAMGLGFSAAGVGDLNDDGIPDLITGNGVGRVTIVSSLAFGQPLQVDGATRDLEYAWTHYPGLPVLYDHGVPRAFSHVPGLSLGEAGDPEGLTSFIVGATPSGTIVFFNERRRDGQRSELMVIQNGVAVTFESLVETFEGDAPPDYARVGLIDIEESNGVAHWALGDPTSVWTFSGGVLTRLWTGSAYDINASGAIVGFLTAAPDETILWTREAGIVEIPELFGILRINDEGDVVGTRVGTRTISNPGTLARWSSGVVTDLVSNFQVADSAFEPSWLISDFDNQGRVLVDLADYPLFSPRRTTTYLFEPGQTGTPDSFRALRGITHALPRTPFGSNVGTTFGALGDEMHIMTDGRMLAYDTVLTAITTTDIATLRENTPIRTATITSGVAAGRYVAAMNQYGELVVFRYQGDEESSWSLIRLTTTPLDDGNDQFAIFTDSHYATPFVAYFDGTNLIVQSALAADGFGTSVSEFLPGSTAIVRGLTVFTNTVGIEHLAGFDSQNNLVIFYRDGRSIDADTNDAWHYNNLSTDHLGIERERVRLITSDLTTYMTPWDGMNIAGVDAQGH